MTQTPDKESTKPLNMEGYLEAEEIFSSGDDVEKENRVQRGILDLDLSGGQRYNINNTSENQKKNSLLMCQPVFHVGKALMPPFFIS